MDDRPTAASASERQLAECVEVMAPMLLRLLGARGGDPDLAQEVAQEALLALVSRWRRIGPPAEPAAFVATIARRRLDRRRLARRAMRSLEVVAGAASREPPPDQMVARRQRLRRAQAALSSLRPGQRRAMELRIAGFDLMTIAQVERVSLGTIKMRLLRARRALAAADAGAGVLPDARGESCSQVSGGGR